MAVARGSTTMIGCHDWYRCIQVQILNKGQIEAAKRPRFEGEAGERTEEGSEEGLGEKFFETH